MAQSSEDTSLPRVERIVRGLLRVCQYASVWAIIFMMILTVANGIGRYALNLPVVGSIELSCFLILAASFLPLGYTLIEQRHIRIGLIIERFSERSQAIIDIVTYILSLAIVIVAVWQTTVRGIYLMQEGKQASGVLLIPIFPFVYLAAFGWGMLGLAIIMNMVKLIPRVVKR